MKNYSLLMLLFLISSCATKNNLNKVEADKIEYQKIWSEAPHSAFTDLIKYNGNYFCAFREAPGHISGPKGTARVVKSADGKNWKTVADFKMDGLDLRDPKLSITPDGKLMVLIDVETYLNDKVDTRKPFVSFASGNGESFSEPVASKVDPKIAVKSDWVWRVTWYNGMGYAINYQPGGVYLMKTSDGKSFENISPMNIDGSPNEATIRFDKNGKMYVLVRREAADKVGVLATSTAPYQNWTFNKMTERIGGPNFIFLNDNTLVMGSRQYIANPPGSAKEYSNYITSLFITDLKGNIKKTIPFEQSGGDTSYPGMYIEGDKLWVSYYSSHEGKSSIYLAKVPLTLLNINK